MAATVGKWDQEGFSKKLITGVSELMTIFRSRTGSEQGVQGPSVTLCVQVSSWRSTLGSLLSRLPYQQLCLDSGVPQPMRSLPREIVEGSSVLWVLQNASAQFVVMKSGFVSEFGTVMKS